jgi:hypothetical protein
VEAQWLAKTKEIQTCHGRKLMATDFWAEEMLFW